jgi:hypothetical protein
MEVVKLAATVETPNSSTTESTLPEKILDAKFPFMARKTAIHVMPHLRFLDQFRGFSLSSGEKST